MTTVDKLREYRVFILFLLVTALFSFLAYLHEQQARALRNEERREAHIRYEQCVERNQNWVAINTALDNIIKYERSLQPTIQNQELITALESGHVKLIDCGLPPPK